MSGVCPSRKHARRQGVVGAITVLLLSTSWAQVAAAQAAAPETEAGEKVIVTPAMEDGAQSLVASLEALDTSAWRTGNGATTSRLAKKAVGLGASASPDTGESTMVASSEVTSAIVDHATMLRSTITDEGFQLTDYQAAFTHEVVINDGKPALEVVVDRSWTEVGHGETTPVGLTETYRVPLESGSVQGTATSSTLAFASEAEGTADEGGPVPDADPLPEPTQTERPDVSVPEDTLVKAQKSAGGLAAKAAIYNFRWRDFRAYGKKWTASPYAGDKKKHFNTKYPYFSNNCANFVSQMWNNSGWKRTGGVNPYDGNNWDDDLTGPAGASRTWSQAKRLYTYADDKKHLYKLGNIWNAVPGNTYFMDWDGDRVINHVAAVTGRTNNGVPRISQKTGNRHNMLLTSWKKLVDADNPNVLWFGLRRTASQ